MKSLFTITVFLVFSFVSCNKDNECDCPMQHECATIVQVTSHCNNFGIKINGQEYPSTNIPPAYQVPGMQVCVKYELYDDMRLCACCGGTWADVKSISQADD